MNQIAVVDNTTNRARVWLASAALSLSIPASLLFTQFLAERVSAALSASLIQRYCLSVTALGLGEWLVMGAFLLVWRPSRQDFGSIGFFNVGTVAAWIVALGIAALSIVNSVNLMRRFGMPVANLWSPAFYHIYAALLIGVTAAVCEEVIFRGYLMTEYARAGYGKFVQVVVPGLFFGLAHLALLQQGVAAGLGVIIPTSMMGMIWGIAFLLGRRSLIPSMVGHFLNDSTALPWILFFMMSRALHH